MATNNVQQVMLKNNRVLAYCAILLVGSTFSLSEDYKIDKSNILNQWFVKIGWFWTTSLLFPLLFIKADDKRDVSQAIFRLVLSSTLWYTSVNLFQYIDDLTEFDISGHTFLLTFSNLLITSELRLINHNQVNRRELKNELEENKYFFSVRLALLILSLLWDFMLIQTALYYHTILQKAIAFIWSLGCWYVMNIFFYEKAQPDSQRKRN